jgi:hypothetical protein
VEYDIIEHMRAEALGFRSPGRRVPGDRRGRDPAQEILLQLENRHARWENFFTEQRLDLL